MKNISFNKKYDIFLNIAANKTTFVTFKLTTLA